MGTGHIEPLKTGFRAAVYAGKDPITGRKRYLKETHPTHAAAVAARDRLLAQVEADSTPDRAATVEVLLMRWMEVVDHEVSTAYTTAGYVKRTIVPALGDMPLRKLQHRVDILDRLYTHLRRCNVLCDGRPTDGHTCKPMSATTVRQIHAILSGALGYAVSWGWIERNPAEYAHPPKLTRRRAHPPEPDQVARLLNAVWTTDVELGMYLWLAVTTGARRGELAGLRWKQVKPERAELVIDRAYVVRGGQRIEKATKTDSDRRLSLDGITLQLLSDFRAVRVEALSPAGLTLPVTAFVFSPDPVGSRPWHPDHFSHAYRKAADALGIVEPMKNLRHFNATQLLAAGVDLSTAAARLGHSDGGATTLRVYANWTKPADQKAVDNLSRGLDARRQSAAREPAEAETLTSPPRQMAIVRAPRAVEEILPGADGATTYLDIAAGLREAVAARRLGPGDLVPTVDQLATRYGVVRSTASRALALAGAEGLIHRTGRRWVAART